MVTLEELHEFAVEQGIEQDPRDRKQIEELLDDREDEHDALEGVRREQFDESLLDNPFDDSRVLYGGDQDVSRLAVGIDMEVPELLLVNRLNDDDEDIDGVISHHPSGRAYATLSNVMKLQIDIMQDAGIPVSQAEAITRKRAGDVRKGLHPRNHPRVPTAARLLDIPMTCMHTITDNFAYQFVQDYLHDEEPRTLDDVIDALLEIPEYQWELGYDLGPEIFNGSPDNRVGELGVLGFTGGTDPGDALIDKMLDAGIDTLIAMHAPKEQIDKAEEHSINVISTGHMSSDSLGMNLLLDRMQDEFDVEFVEMSGFTRVERS